MHTQTLQHLQHSHDFTHDHAQGERRTQYVLWLTAITMVVEILAGEALGSMALLADGWHMSTHVVAFLITIFAYRFARRNVHNPAYTFGTGKVNVLGGFASAVALAVVALMMAMESLQRLFNPETIQFNEAIAIAALGLGVNLLSAGLLRDDHPHEHGHHHHDQNLHAAYVHVLADALTSVLAIVALIAGKYFGVHWLDAIMGVVGAVIIGRWSLGLLRQSAPILLDASIEARYRQAIQDRLEQDADNKIADLHVWKVGAEHYAAILSLVTHHPKPARHYKDLLRDFPHLSHITVEVNPCSDETCPEGTTP